MRTSRDGPRRTGSPILSFDGGRAMFTMRRMSIFAAGGLLLAGCASQNAGIPHASIPLGITSVPSGACVMYGAQAMYFDEKSAVALGKTPLLRNLPPDAAGARIQITKLGYREWSGTLSPAATRITAELQPLSDQEKADRGWMISPPATALTVVPLRVGLHQVGNAAFESTPEATRFRARVVQLLGGALEKRFPGKVAVVDAPAQASEGAAWGALETQISKIRLDKLGCYPVPVRFDIPAGIASAFANANTGVLLVRAEAYYQSSGQRVARAAGPILWSIVSAAAVSTAAQALALPAGTIVTYPVFGPSPDRETVLFQMFLVHAQTRELLWYGQLSTQQYFNDDGVIESITLNAADQIPSAYLAGGTP